MNDELDHLWTQRPDVEAPADFADRVMDAVRREPRAYSKGVRGRRLWSPAVRGAASILACLACLYRMAAVIGVFFVP